MLPIRQNSSTCDMALTVRNQNGKGMLKLYSNCFKNDTALMNAIIIYGNDNMIAMLPLMWRLIRNIYQSLIVSSLLLSKQNHLGNL